jgi:NAD(P)-dependent dehydrogenase (short-subunit alcohol dehydrogenase family)
MILQGKVALVTGDTSGIGRTTALAKLNEVIRIWCCWSKGSILRQTRRRRRKNCQTDS